MPQRNKRLEETTKSINSVYHGLFSLYYSEHLELHLLLQIVNA